MARPALDSCNEYAYQMPFIIEYTDPVIKLLDRIYAASLHQA